MDKLSSGSLRPGVIGLGVVGKAVLACLKRNNFSALGYDIKTHAPSDLNTLLVNTNILFLCLPTPTFDDGRQDDSSVKITLSKLHDSKYSGVIVIKSTVLPGKCSFYCTEYPGLRIVHNPEFLTERTAAADFRNQTDILLSGQFSDVSVISDLYDRILPSDVITYHHSTKYEVTEWAKYIHNTILPIQLSYLNELYKLIDDADIYNKSVQMAASQGNLNNHYLVPGPDGKMGWGGMCFTKDTAALIKDKEDSLSVLKSAIGVNNKIRVP